MMDERPGLTHRDDDLLWWMLKCALHFYLFLVFVIVSMLLCALTFKVAQWTWHVVVG